ncbi:hypothetical protein FJZ31_26140 [Candidatus Poribacteria bacterium]|nr:hypothetical protein [Candidatus Poribacteria bacterium]
MTSNKNTSEVVFGRENYSLINHVVHVPSLERRIDEQNIERLLAGFSDRVLREKVGYALLCSLKEISGQFSDLVAEVHATESFGDGEITGQYNLLVIIKEERYSVIEVILKLADAIFGPLFLETGVLFGLTVMSEQEWNKLRSSEETTVSDTLGRTVCLLSTGVNHAA